VRTFRYVAVPLGPTGEGDRTRRGEMIGASEADVRQALRRIGWQVIDLKALRAARQASAGSAREAGPPWRLAVDEYRRRRRQRALEDVLDGLALLLETGVPAPDAVRTLAQADRTRGGATRRMLMEFGDALSRGATVAEAAGAHRDWFDAVELAMFEAAEHRGDLASTTRTLAQRRGRHSELWTRVVSALAYPAVIAAVGSAVTAFLALYTLPRLASILVDSRLEVPALTRGAIALGQFFASTWFMLPFVAAAGLAVGAVVRQRLLADRAGQRFIARISPAFLRRLAVGSLWRRTAELLGAGVPLGEAMRIAARASGRALREAIEEASRAIEQGQPIDQALRGSDWFDAESRKVIEVAQESGEIGLALERIGERCERDAERLVGRLVSILEPAVIVALAAAIGVVVMAAILPLVRMQEILQ